MRSESDEAPGTGTGAPDPTAARTREELTVAMAAGAQPKWLFFWGHQPRPDGAPGPGVLSQWWECATPFVIDGVPYPTAEHWMMAEKARLFGDDEAARAILAARTPGEAKKLGRTVRDFDDAAWNAARFELVVRGNVAKFGQDPALRDYLLATRHRVLVEASPRDRIWGIGLAATNEHATDPARWRGHNLLGFALMEARERLAAC